jgi:hypothetical protein
MQQAVNRREMNRGFWWANLNKRDHLEDLDIDGRIHTELNRSLRNKMLGHGLDWSGLG